MSRMVMIGSTRDPKPDTINDLDIDELVERLSPGEIQRLLDECDPDDPSIPPSLRNNYKCEKQATGPLNRQKLLDYINDQALNTPDIIDPVPHVPGTIRGKKWQPPPKPISNTKFDEAIELDIDLGDECELALNSASTEEIVDLAGILGLHSMMNQDQFHAAQTDKWAVRADPEVGWNGITKATPLKQFPPEQPNNTKPEEVISNLRDNEGKEVNLNNVIVSDQQFAEIFDALRDNKSLIDLSMANCKMSDASALQLASALESNTCLEKLNIETNNITPLTLVKIFEAANIQNVLKEIKASNQQAQFLGNKAEMAITKAVEKSKSIMKVGLHFEFGDCRNRVAVQLQKNLDRVRLKRVAHKLNVAQTQNGSTNNKTESSGSRTGGYFGTLPGQISHLPRQKSPEEEEYEDEEEED